MYLLGPLQVSDPLSTGTAVAGTMSLRGYGIAPQDFEVRQFPKMTDLPHLKLYSVT